MKRIILLTDFSETARNALIYGIEMFKKENVEFVLLNTYDMDLGGSAYLPQLKEQLAEISEDGLEKELVGLKNIYPKLNIKIRSEYGPLIEVLQDLSDSNIDKPEFIVLGCRGETVLENFFMGSNAFEVVKHVNLPLLLVPKDTDYKPLKKIAFATDLKTIDKTIAEPLYNLVSTFDAELMFVNVIDDSPVNRIEAEEVIAKYFPKVKLSFNFIDDPDIHKGISTFSLDHDADVIAMVRFNYSFFERFFKPSITKKMVMQPPCPIVVLHNTPK